MLELKRDYAVLEEKIELNSSDILRLLGISKASLARWRNSKDIPYRYVSCNHVVYPFKGLYIAIKTGRASLQRLSESGSLAKTQCLQGRYPERLHGRRTNIIRGTMNIKEEILERTNRGLEVFCFYMPIDFVPKRNFRNPLYEDKRASCSIYHYYYARLLPLHQQCHEVLPEVFLLRHIQLPADVVARYIDVVLRFIEQ